MSVPRNNLLAALLPLVLVTPAIAEEPGYGIVVEPEQPTAIRLSNRDMNRIVCRGGQIEDFRYSAEKGVVGEAAGADFFIKFRIRKVSENLTYVTQRSEFFVRCAGQMFTLHAEPTNIASQTVFLDGGDLAQADAVIEAFAPMSQEERALKLTRAVLREEFTDAYRIEEGMPDNYTQGPLSGTFLQHRRDVRVEGLGLTASEYLFRADRDFLLDERLFLDPRFGSAIYAITVDQPELKAGEIGRVVIVSRTRGGR